MAFLPMLAYIAAFLHKYTESPLSLMWMLELSELEPLHQTGSLATAADNRKVKYMTGTNENELIEQLIAVAPEHEQMLRTRDHIVAAYCAEHGIDRNNPTMDQLLEIRALPEWQAAGEL